jgi:hypothetical protein
MVKRKLLLVLKEIIVYQQRNCPKIIIAGSSEDGKIITVCEN